MKKRILILILTVLSVFNLFAFTAFADSPFRPYVGTVNDSMVQLMKEPYSKGIELDVARNGDIVIVLEIEKNNWLKVNYNNKTGYMKEKNISKKEKETLDIGYAQYLEDTSILKTPAENAEEIASVKKDDIGFLVGYEADCFLVEYEPEEYGYVRIDDVELLEIPYGNKDSKGNTYNISELKEKEMEKYKEEKREEARKAARAGVVNYAMQYLGYRYVWGGTSPSYGFDCSGFAQYVYKQCGYKIGRTTSQQNLNGISVGRAELEPGDLLLFAEHGSFTHTAIYIGGGQFIHAANSRSGVIISSLDEPYYSSRFVCGRRIIY